MHRHKVEIRNPLAYDFENEKTLDRGAIDETLHHQIERSHRGQRSVKVLNIDVRGLLRAGQFLEPLSPSGEEPECPRVHIKSQEETQQEWMQRGMRQLHGKLTEMFTREAEIDNIVK